MTHTDWIGAVGVFLILLAYVLSALEKISTKDLSYILLNVVGAGIACYASILMDYIPFIILEGVWTAVSLVSLFRYKRS